MSANQFVSARTTDQILGVSEWAQNLRSDIRQVAPHDSSVVIAGPTGTGKELVARAIHTESPRADKPYIPVNCAAITGSLFESHMFGHVKGAFTGAHYDALGCFRAADGGTIFLDEVGELEFDLQAKLLRTIQERFVVPVGSFEGVPVDVRIITATNRDLREEVVSKRFREDLYYRLNVVSLRTMALSDRPEDIEPISQQFLERLADRNGLPFQKLSVAALAWMHEYDWPGNVRQLENVLERAVIFAKESDIGPELLEDAVSGTDLPLADSVSSTTEKESDFGEGGPSQEEVDTAMDGSATAAKHLTPEEMICQQARRELGLPATGWLKLADLERYHIRQTLMRTFFNQTAAADLLGISFRVLARKVKNHHIDTSQSRRGRPKKNRFL